MNDRLLEVVYPDVTTTYTYDPAYNRLSETDTVNGTVSKSKTYHYNQRNQLTSVDDNLDSNNNVVYLFDQNGNQIQKSKNGETTRFVFDIRDDLRQVQIGGSTVGQFLYDYQGLRIEKLGERGAERSTYDDQSILQQYPVQGCNAVGDESCITGETGQTRAKFDYGASSLLSLNTLNEPPQFYLYDVLNSVANLTNSEGAVQARYQYDAWGIKRNEVGESYNRFAFTGYEEDKETGLLYAKARFYDPDTGKFLSEDAWEGDNTIAPSLHRYLYAYQNPTVYVDRDGNQAQLAQEATKVVVRDVGAKMTTIITSQAAANTAAAASTRSILAGLGPPGQFIAGMWPADTATDSQMQSSPWVVLDDGVSFVRAGSEEHKEYERSRREREHFSESNPDLLDARSGLAPPVASTIVSESESKIENNKASRSIFNNFPEKTDLKFKDINEQAEFLSKNIPGLSTDQAMNILNKGFQRDSSVVIGGSRVRGDFHDGSDIDVGFGNLSKRQTQRVIKQLNNQRQDGDLHLEDDIRIAPGVETETVPVMKSPEEFFQRSGVRSGGDPKAGQPFMPSGSVTAEPDGSVKIRPPEERRAEVQE